MPLPSYRVESPVYIRPPSFVKVKTPEIKPEEHRSMIQAVSNSFSSWPYDLSKQTSPTIIDDVAYMRSSGRLEAFSLGDVASYGLATAWEERGPLFQSWLDAGQKYGTRYFDYVRLPQKNFSSGVVESFGDRPARFHPDDTPVRKDVRYFRADEWPNNQVGKAVSSIENIRQSLTRYLRTADAQELSKYMGSLGYRAADIDNLGVGYLPERAIFGVGRTESGRIRLMAAEDAYAKIVTDAKFLGVKPEDLLNSILAEEIAHIWRRDIDKESDSIDIEIAAKELVARHYQRLADGADGDPKKAELRRRYQKLAAVKKFDAETTPQRYGKRAGLEKLIETLELEAEELGVDKAEYISTQLAKHPIKYAERADNKESSQEAMSEAPAE